MGVEIMAPPGMEEMTSQLQSMFQNLGGQKQKPRKLKIKDAMKLLVEEEAAKLVNPEELKQELSTRLNSTASCLSMKLTKFVSVAKPPARMFHAKAYSATYCRW